MTSLERWLWAYGWSQSRPRIFASTHQAACEWVAASAVAGMGALGFKTVAALKQALPSLEAAVAVDEAAGQDFYQFAFRYCLTVRG